MEQPICVTPGCDRPVWVKRTGECSTCQSRRYRRENPGKGRTQHKRTCPCGAEFTATTSSTRFCSMTCVAALRAPAPPRLKKIKPPRPPFDPRSELRRGYEDGDVDLFFAALVAKAQTDGDCWVWPKCKDGYPQVNWGKKSRSLHRLVRRSEASTPTTYVQTVSA